MRGFLGFFPLKTVNFFLRGFSMYQAFYDLLVDKIFSGSIEGIAYGDFFCSGLSIIACGLLVALPFIILWRLFRKFL